MKNEKRGVTVMKHCLRFSFFLFVLVLMGCGADKDRVTIKGHFNNLANGEFFAFSHDPAWGSIDTIRIENGSFEFSRPLMDTVVVTIQYPNFLQTQLIAAPENVIKIKGDASNLQATEISGSEENELLTTFRLGIIGLKQADIIKQAEAFIQQHPSSYAAMALLAKYFVQVEQPDYKKATRLAQTMQKAAPWRMALRTLSAQLQETSAAQVGGKAPAFSACTIDGDTVTNKTFQRQAYVVWFWSSWGYELSAPMRQQRDMMRQHTHLAALNVCLSADSAECRFEARYDSLFNKRTYNVCDRMVWDSPLVRKFAIERLPTAVLVDTAGRIVARCQTTDELQKHLTDDL